MPLECHANTDRRRTGLGILTRQLTDLAGRDPGDGLSPFGGARLGTRGELGKAFCVALDVIPIDQIFFDKRVNQSHRERTV